MDSNQDYDLDRTGSIFGRDLGLSILTILAAGASVNFFVLSTAGVVPFSEYRNYILIPSFFIILSVAIYGYKKNKRLANRLVTGLWIGIIATLALEAIRIPSIYAHWIPHDNPPNPLQGKLEHQDSNAMNDNMTTYPPKESKFQNHQQPATARISKIDDIQIRKQEHQQSYW